MVGLHVGGLHVGGLHVQIQSGLDEVINMLHISSTSRVFWLLVSTVPSMSVCS